MKNKKKFYLSLGFSTVASLIAGVLLFLPGNSSAPSPAENGESVTGGSRYLVTDSSSSPEQPNTSFAELSLFEKSGSDIATSGSYQFSSPVLLENLSFSNSDPHLISGTAHFLLFTESGHKLYAYDTRKKSKWLVHDGAKLAVVSPDHRYIFFTAETKQGDNIYTYSLEHKALLRKSTNYEDKQITQLVFNQGALYFSSHPFGLPNQTSVYSFIPNAYTFQFPSSARSVPPFPSFSLLDVNQDRTVSFSPSTQSIMELSLTNPAVSLGTILEEVPNALQLKVSSGNKPNWALLYEKNTTFHVNINGTTVEKTAIITDIDWLSENLLLWVDNSSLYLYNVATQEKTKLHEPLTSFSVTEKAIYAVSGNEVVAIKYQKE